MRLESLETLTLLKTNCKFFEENDIDIQELKGSENNSEDSASDDSSEEDFNEESDGPDDVESEIDRAAEDSD